MKIATAPQMRELDRKAIQDFHIPGMILMENAGRGTVDFMLSRFGPVAGKSALIFIGPGNNGGDGLVIARHIHQLGGFPHLFYLTQPEALKGDAGLNQQITASLGLPFFIIDEASDINSIAETILNINSRQPVWSFVDALFGTGLTRELSGRFRHAVNLINTMSKDLSCPVTAVDMPSGLESDSGAILGECTRATITATYGLAKPAHYLHGGPFVGELKVVDIGIPPRAVETADLQGETLGPELLRRPRPRHPAAHKGGFGHLLILAGSTGKTGAAMLSALGALRCGTGLVSLATPHELNAIFETVLLESMTITLPYSRCCLSIDDYDLIAEHIKRKNALVIGPGIGTEAVTRELVLKLYREQPLPMVVDADALNILAMKPDMLANAAGPRILTPHPGEMARLLGVTSAEIQADRLAATARLAKIANGAGSTNSTDRSDITIVLKGAGTICHAADNSWAINTSGNPGMACGGMGDVLSGLIGGLLAQGYPPRQAAELGIYVHGLAADLLACKRNFGYTASEVANHLPYAFNINSLEEK